MLNLSLSSYYYKSKEQALLETKEKNDLQDHIEQIALEFPRYGYRLITHQLEREGVTVNHKRVLRLMRESSLLVVAKRKWVKTTDSNHRYPIYPNLVRILS
jgi:putative transposase